MLRLGLEPEGHCESTASDSRSKVVYNEGKGQISGLRNCGGFYSPSPLK